MKQYLVLLLVFLILLVVVSCEVDHIREEIIHQRGGFINRELYREKITD